jgi:hypothetical protein
MAGFVILSIKPDPQASCGEGQERERSGRKAPSDQARGEHQEPRQDADCERPQNGLELW